MLDKLVVSIQKEKMTHKKLMKGDSEYKMTEAIVGCKGNADFSKNILG